MRQGKLTADEVLETEKAVDDRKNFRSGGFSKMRERDKGHARLNNGAVIVWPTDRELNPGEARLNIPEDKFLLIVGKEQLLFDAEEFRKYLRWV